MPIRFHDIRECGTRHSIALKQVPQIWILKVSSSVHDFTIFLFSPDCAQPSDSRQSGAEKHQSRGKRNWIGIYPVLLGNKSGYKFITSFFMPPPFASEFSHTHGQIEIGKLNILV